MRLFGLGRRAPPQAVAAVPEGMRIYAIGDVHGRFDLMTLLIERIAADDAARQPSETHVVMLGDLIDRGAESAQVIDFFLRDTPPFARFHQLMGNHEEMLLRLIDRPSEEAMAHFLRYGGRETFESYGTPQLMLDLADRYPPSAILAHVPETHRAFLRGMGDAIQVGDYLFVHAGIRPGVPLEDQAPEDVRWIRQPFLDSDEDHGAVVVHGHTISAAPEMRRNRIGIDTGAYASDVLTAVGLEGTERWLLNTAA
ncbi:metallophosphoesterase family protein [Sphingomonas nostoxanthinifaciens]|uniref:metallophosphoesterase family protein n=1 Tax=Sphingomonas nostoxanthinifaciens TaxID=2872652 RepID=UPI001CC1D9A7|nr:metallophosphoesterase family protein [Sphingomonas nostoxanthinifaciens]UAK25838.1 serine/threonine protein phosphatase [Sphingomonas nostoxanthinifaciens]